MSSLTEEGIVIEVKPVPLKAPTPIYVTVFGIFIEMSMEMVKRTFLKDSEIIQMTEGLQLK